MEHWQVFVKYFGYVSMASTLIVMWFALTSVWRNPDEWTGDSLKDNKAQKEKEIAKKMLEGGL